MEPVELVADIPGWLQPEDGRKLYELGHETVGPILEVGSHHGKSTTLLALAAREAGIASTIYSLDIDPRALRAARRHSVEYGVADRIIFFRSTLQTFSRVYPALRPALTFVDGDHSRAAVARDCDALHPMVPAGGRLLFHDFNDPRNDDPACSEIKVRPAVQASWVARECEFNGVFGACGEFTRRESPPAASAREIDLLPLGDARDQMLYRMRYPASRLWRRIRPRAQ